MAPRQRLAWTPSADVLWNGELPDAFRGEAGQILGQPLTDAAWEGLLQVTFAYSFLLNHEHAAAPLADQKKAASDLLAATDALLAAIDRADTIPLGLIVRNRVADKWDEIWDHGAEFDRNVKIMVDDMVAAFGDTHPNAEEQAWRFIGDWQQHGRLVRPSQPADMIGNLRVFRDAVRLFSNGLSNETEPVETAGLAWVEFIGQLTEWAKLHGLRHGVSKSGDRGGVGAFTLLVKAINDLVPELHDEATGKPADKQMRRPLIEPSSLAASILTARAEYEARRPVMAAGDA